jgi:outer membrane protein
MTQFLPGRAFCFLLLLQGAASAQIGATPPPPVVPSAVSAPKPNPPQQEVESGPEAKRPSVPLTLAAAEAKALKNLPRLRAQRLRAQAAGKRITESRSAYFPQAAGNLTAVEANGDSAVAAGALTTSSISSRAAVGGTLVQMITDFGQTSNRVQSARFAAKAADQDEERARQFTIMQVREAYFAAQAAQSVLGTAQAVLDFRRVTLRQLSALAQSQLRSTLDVQFAQVLVSEAELAQVQAVTSVRKTQAQLGATMGEESEANYTFTDEPLPANPDQDSSGYIAEAITDRPDLKALHLRSESAMHQARAERDLNFPTLNALAAGGEAPVHDATIQHEYGAVGVNVNIPIFNGGLYSSRAAAARLEANAADQDASQRKVEVVRDVRMAWADARDAYLEIGVTQRLVEESGVAMRLAQARYDANLGSIVELNQAELNQTSALIGAATARFDYQRAMTEFQFEMGNLP